MSSYTGWGELTVPGEVTGYRAWTPLLGIMRPALSAYTVNYEWLPGKNVAGCHRGSRMYFPVPSMRVPDKNCACGFYARTEDDRHGYDLGICGVIKASGRLILGQDGFRAEFARIVALYPSKFISGNRPILQSWAETWDEALTAWSRYYEVPLFRNFREAAEAFPPDDLSAFRKKPSPSPSTGTRTAIVTRLDVNGQPITGSGTTVQLPGWPGSIF